MPRICKSDFEYGMTKKCSELKASVDETKEHIILVNNSMLVDQPQNENPNSTANIKGSPTDNGKRKALALSDTLTVKGCPRVENTSLAMGRNQTTYGMAIKVDNITKFSTSTVNIVERAQHGGETPESTTTRGEAPQRYDKGCESNRTELTASPQSKPPSPVDAKWDNFSSVAVISDKIFGDNESALRSSQEIECLSLAGEHVRVNDKGFNGEATNRQVLIQTQTTTRTRIRKAPSVSKLKMALFLEASKAHSENGAERIFANYWETLGQYLTLESHGALKRVRPDLRSRAGIESILSGFLKTRKMKLLHNKLILCKFLLARYDQHATLDVASKPHLC